MVRKIIYGDVDLGIVGLDMLAEIGNDDPGACWGACLAAGLADAHAEPVAAALSIITCCWLVFVCAGRARSWAHSRKLVRHPGTLCLSCVSLAALHAADNSNTLLLVRQM